jgi:hypothetical protein
MHYKTTLVGICFAFSSLILSGWSLPKIKNPIKSIADGVSGGGGDAVEVSGDYSKAVKNIDKQVEKEANGKDGVLLLLEQGAILRAASVADVPIPKRHAEEAMESQSPALYFLTRSNLAFDAAEQRVNDFEQSAKLRLGSEGMALLTNQASRDYAGRAYDKVMMNTYKALNYMHLGNFDAARVELNRSLQRQRDAVDQNAREIEEAEAAIAEEEGAEADKKLERARSDPKSNQALSEIETEFNSRIRAYGPYVNPFSVFLDGLFQLHAGQDASDLERARKSFERVAGMIDDRDYILADLHAAEQAKRPDNTTYVIFETGRAPSRGETVIDLPALLVTSEISYVGAAFPKLLYNEEFASNLVATAAGQRYESVLLCSMDSVVSQDFKNDWPIVIRRTIASSGTKAVADTAIQNAAGSSFGFAGQLITKATTAGIQKSLNKADTRTWQNLPKEFHLLRMPTPQDGQIYLDAAGSNAAVTVAPGAVNVVVVKSDKPDAPLLVSQFKF